MRYAIALLSLFFIPSHCISHNYDYDLIIIGAGAAGTKAAVLAHNLGKKVVLIEKDKVGGGRIWHGDIPFKSFYSLANKLASAQELAQFGIAKNRDLQINDANIFPLIKAIQNDVYELYYKKNYLENKIPIISGSPSFIDQHTLSVNNQTVSAKNFIIATGAQAYIPPIPGLESVDYITRENFFNLTALPKSIIIIGGGPLGVELAAAMAHYGVQVTLLIKHALLLPTYDFEIVEYITESLLAKGITIISDTRVQSVQKTTDRVQVTALNRADKKIFFESEALFIACGSHPNTHGLALEKAGITLQTDAHEPNFQEISKNAIMVNKHLQTSTPHIFACGDVTGIQTLSRVAFYHAQLAIHNMYSSSCDNQESNYKSMAKVLFAHPEEFASTGLSEQEALRIYGEKILIYHYDYSSLARAHIDNAQKGIAKFICDMDGIILGAHIYGAFAGKLIDMIHAGDDLKKFTEENNLKISTSPSYRELLYEVSQACKTDVEKNKKPPSEPHWLEILFTPSLWGKKR